MGGHVKTGRLQYQIARECQGEIETGNLEGNPGKVVNSTSFKILVNTISGQDQLENLAFNSVAMSREECRIRRMEICDDSCV